MSNFLTSECPGISDRRFPCLCFLTNEPTDLSGESGDLPSSSMEPQSVHTPKRTFINYP